ncbi:response regulator transcription factor [Acetobacter peroxydans]|uniref:DNA-binding response regulator n=1 Tax=Acetobacter peroxydans TaxID=104098 RepID=A0A4Y3TXJ9_9PROT|nr:response regulator transcription factor [Acetobacter peroxydans]NHO15942.1 response regulator [Acetobacter peroxydans]GBR36898.1 two component response regulator [Acetobacter peroxydans NBRC 13755]GBR43945.1 two component response regulator [Acetobacter peroxydans]GEB86458.1 DNA-binding response regulator [Acetobacter peroxydans]
MRVLLVEDDQTARGLIVKSLIETGHLVEQAEDERQALLHAGSADFDVIILDRVLPDSVDGLHVLTTLRKMGNTTPVLLLSALSDVEDKVAGLKAGADDYMTKPFSFAELLARLEALTRRNRTTAQPPTHLDVGDLAIDLLSRTVHRAGQKIDLQPREFRLLEFLMRHAGKVVTRAMLLEGVWDYHFDPQTNVIDVHISRLRQKIDKPFEHPMLQTVRNAGYMLACEIVPRLP